MGNQKMTPALKKFYVDIQAAIDAEVKPKWFDPDVGLCSNFANWRQTCMSVVTGNQLQREMQRQFLAAGFRTATPFNSSIHEYKLEAMASKIYSNPARLQWIKDHAS